MSLPLPNTVGDPLAQENFDAISSAFPLPWQNIAGLPIKAGIPEDADYGTPPPIGSLVLDTADARLYVRVGIDTWAYATLT